MTTDERVSTAVLCEAAGISTPTLQRWVARGLLPRCVRMNPGKGVRGMYPATALERVREIAAMRARGFSLDEIAAKFEAPKRRSRGAKR